MVRQWPLSLSELLLSDCGGGLIVTLHSAFIRFLLFLWMLFLLLLAYFLHHFIITTSVVFVVVATQ